MKRFSTFSGGRKVKQCDSGDYTLYKDTDILEVEGMDPITPPSSGSKVRKLKSGFL